MSRAESQLRRTQTGEGCAGRPVARCLLVRRRRAPENLPPKEKSPRAGTLTRTATAVQARSSVSTLAQRTVLAGLVADGLDVVAVGIENVAPVVVGVVPA